MHTVANPHIHRITYVLTCVCAYMCVLTCVCLHVCVLTCVCVCACYGQKRFDCMS